MSFTTQTPQKLLPGAYVPTPAVSRIQLGQPFKSSFQPITAVSVQQNDSVSQSHALAPQLPSGTEVAKPSQEVLKPLERAAKTINDTLSHEARYPELDSYIGRKFPT